jgi:cell division septation protein DedD
MNKYRSAALALAACAASLSVAACSSGTPAASSAGTSSATPSQSASAAITSAVPTTGAPIAGKTVSVNGKLTSFPVPAAAKLAENMGGGQALVLIFGAVAPADVARFYATALPQAGYSVSTSAMLSKGGDNGAYIVFSGHGYKGTVDSLAQFPGTSVVGIGDKNVTTIIFAPSK